jgi:quinol-cytochrome oxidoreductase complex cytochrome b subunit
MRYNEKWVWGTTRFYPHEMTNMIQVVLVCLAVLLAISIYKPGLFIPPEEPANPTVTPEHIKPEWYFMGSYQALKEFKTISMGESFEVSGEVQGIVFQMVVILAMFTVPFWERGKRNPSDPKKANKLSVIVAGGGILILLLGIISNLRQGTGVSGIILHVLVILGLVMMPYIGSMGGRSVRMKSPLFLATVIAITGFVYLTVKGLLV